jgi:hypothetical protein
LTQIDQVPNHQLPAIYVASSLAVSSLANYYQLVPLLSSNWRLRFRQDWNFGKLVDALLDLNGHQKI